MTTSANTGQSEANTRANFIDPAITAAGWESGQVIREYYFTDGRKLSAGQRGTRCFVDYLRFIRLKRTFERDIAKKVDIRFP